MQSLVRTGSRRLFGLALALLVAHAAVAQDRYFASNGVKIHYIDQGAGDAVVLVHGYTRDLNDWVRHGVVQALAREYRVIALDVRGHGRSDKPHDVAAYGKPMVDDIVRLLDTLGVPKAHVLGFSMGGRIAASFAADHPDRLLSLTLAAGWPSLGHTAAQDSLAEVVAKEMERGSLRTVLSAIAPQGEARPTEEQLQQRSSELLAGQDVLALAAAARGVRAMVVTRQQLEQLTVPTLLIVGSLDGAARPGRSLAGMLPRSRFVVVDGATHATIVGSPEFLRAVRSTFDSARVRR